MFSCISYHQNGFIFDRLGCLAPYFAGGEQPTDKDTQNNIEIVMILVNINF
jgi:hypothetical protein